MKTIILFIILVSFNFGQVHNLVIARKALIAAGGEPTTVLYYFDSYDIGVEEWETTPANMVDNVLTNYAATNTEDRIQLLDGNTCAGADLGTITKVELRAYGVNGHGAVQVFLRPVFSGGDGDDNNSLLWVTPGWGTYVDITSNTNAEDWAGWNDIQNLDCDIYENNGGTSVSKVEIRVTYIP